MAIDKKEFEKLSPEERIKRLKELEEERKKDIDEAEDLIKKTEAEIRHIKTIPKIEVPRIEPIDISKIFESPTGLETTLRGGIVVEEISEIRYIPVIYDLEIGSALGEIFSRIDEKERIAKIEETIKYESSLEKADTTASRTILKEIRRYTMG